MEPLQLTLAGLMAVAALVFVVHPLLRRSPRDTRHSQHRASADMTLLERRDRALAALKELEFDHRTGTISDSDYRSLLPPLRRAAAETLRRPTGADAQGVRRERPRKKPRSRRRAGGLAEERR